MENLDLHSFCTVLGFDSTAETLLKPHWETLCEHAQDGVPEFMTPEFYKKYCRICAIPEDVLPRMDAVAAVIRKSSEWSRFASMMHYAFFCAPPMIDLSRMPLPVHGFGENVGVFQLMIAMSAIPLIAELHRQKGYPEKYALASATWVGGTVPIYAAAHDGLPGHTLSQTPHLRDHVEGHVIQIGRLEFVPGSWTDQMPAVYRRTDGTLAVLCRNNWSFNKKNLRVFPSLETPAYTVKMTIRNGKVTGTPIGPDGTIFRGKEITLDLKEWTPLCTPWDLVLTIHIPGGGGLTMEKIRDSFVEAKEFFLKYYGSEVKAFICGSWIFNPFWQDELPDSNMAAFQRNVYMTEIMKTAKSGLFFVYGRETGDPRQWQCTTRLHKAFCKIFENGDSLAYGHVFVLAEDAEQFGTEYYRKKAKNIVNELTHE